MKITLAKHSGFCMGVRNAILRTVQEINSSDEELYVYGPLIHNPQTIAVLNSRGLRTIKNLNEIAGRKIAIRTHGIPIEEIRILKKCAARVINLTCPRVARVQAIIKKYSGRGYHTIITGDKEHAEVIGLESYAANGVTLISDQKETVSLPAADNYIMVSQTTFDREQFKIIAAGLQRRYPNITVVDTICDSTRYRQEDVTIGVSGDNDTLVVVGGKNSANTKRLAQIGRDSNIRTFHIETESELNPDDFSGSKSVLVTAGTSTPGWIINNVLEKLYTIKFRKGNVFLRSLVFPLEFVVRTNLLSSAAAFFMTCATLAFSGGAVEYAFPAISFLFIFSMYSINNYFERKSLKLSNPYKYVIYERYGIPLLIISIAFMLTSVVLAGRFGPATVSVVAASCLIGFLYSTAPVKTAIKRINIRIFGKLYNSKMVTCFGWILISVLLPMPWTGPDVTRMAALSALVFTLVFLRTILLDLIAFQGDVILGKETMPLWLGTRNIRIISVVISAAGALIFGWFTIINGSYPYLLFVFNIVYFLVLMNIINRLNYLISLKYELLVDANFIVMIVFYYIARFAV